MAKVNKRLMRVFDIWQPSMISSLGGHRISAQNRQIWLTLGTISVQSCMGLSLWLQMESQGWMKVRQGIVTIQAVKTCNILSHVVLPVEENHLS